MLATSPKGTAPALVLVDRTVIDESINIMRDGKDSAMSRITGLKGPAGKRPLLALAKPKAAGPLSGRTANIGVFGFAGATD